MAPSDQVPFEFFHIQFIVGGIGANSPHPKGLAVGDASLAVRRIATTMVEVLMGVHRLVIEISDQAVPVAYHCCIKEHYRLSRPLGSELDGWAE